MLGHKLWQNLHGRFDTYVTFRRSAADYARCEIFERARAVENVSAREFETVVRAFATVCPDVVVNCIGIVKQDAAAKDPYQSILVNALFPQQLAGMCREASARLIHISTDCVFSGRKGNYSELDKPDAEDLYGRTKLLGEVDGENCLTLRTSMIGPELRGAHGLVEWFLGQRGKTVRGFKRAVFSGFTTRALSAIITDIIVHQAELHGIWHVAAEPINKFDLLMLLKEVYGLKIEIEPDETFACDRSLDGARFRAATAFVPPAWPEMIAAMRQDPTPYEHLRRLQIQR